MNLGLRAVSVCVVLCCMSCSAPLPPPASTVAPPSANLRPWQKPYRVQGVSYTPLLDHQGFVEQGLASWYGKDFHGRKTSNGEIYDMYAMTAAHKTLPLGVCVRVENKNNGRVEVARINDRGPFVAGRIIDLSYTLADKLGVVGPGTAPVVVTALGFARQDAEGRTHYTLPETLQSGPFMIQVGAFSQQQNAAQLQARLQQRYGHADVREALVAGQRYFRVRAGEFHSLAEAGQAQAALAADGYAGFVVARD